MVHLLCRLICSMATAALTIVVMGCASHSAARAPARDMEAGMVMMTTKAGDEEQPCALYVPEHYEEDRPWPLVVFLHGMGERGSDGVAQTTVGIGPAIKAHPDRFPCLVLMPQCSTSYVWTSPKAEAHIDDAIAQVREGYNVDAARISLTGLSMGGFGAFRYGAEHADLFSAIMPICGGGDVEDAEALTEVPMWVFHGGADPVVPPRRSRTMVEAIKAAGGDVRYTEYEGVGHNSWDRAYNDAEAIAWLLRQRNEGRE